MEAPKHVLQRAQWQRKRFWCAVATLSLAVIVVVVAIPCALLLPNNFDLGVPADVLLPLYIYPASANAWDPLYRAVNGSKHLDFIVVLNPHNGPGSSDSPGPDYISAAQRLSTASNVKTVGYVRTDYARRNISSALRDVATYSRWNVVANGLAVHGIFFDETPSYYSPQKAEYMTQINEAVKSSSGILEPRLIIHNPGRVPSPQLNDSQADITVIFEQSFEQFQLQSAALSSLSGSRSRYSVLVHSVPSDANTDQLVRNMSRAAKFLFTTTEDGTYYNRFGRDWSEFIGVIGS